MRANLTVMLLVASVGCRTVVGGGSDGGGGDGAAAAGDLASATRFGAACHSDGECPRLCVQDAPFSGGYCSQIELDCGHPSSAADCPSGTLCRRVTIQTSPSYPEDLCLRQCGSDGDCRSGEGYRCCARPAGSPGPDGKSCMPSSAC
jgi:hypothetical protein